MKISIKDFLSKFVAFTEEILNEKTSYFVQCNLPLKLLPNTISKILLYKTDLAF